MTRPLLTLCAALTALASLFAAETPNNETSVQKLRVEKFVLPDFPDFVRLSGTGKGMVTVAIGRDGEGRVTDVLVLDSTSAKLSQATVTAVEQWKFKLPANPAPIGHDVVPIVRFIFTTKGVQMVTALTGTLAAKDREVNEKSPVILPSFADLDTPPKAISHPMPRFTGALAERAAGGTVTVKFFVDETGKVSVPIILDCSVPELGRAALAAVEQWRFEPPRAAGHETIALETQTFGFGPPKS